MSNREIAERLDVTRASIYYRLEKLGLANNCHKDQMVDPEKVRILHERGLTTIGIALILKTNAKVVAEQLKELGLKDNYHQLNEVINGSEYVEEGDRNEKWEH